MINVANIQVATLLLLSQQEERHLLERNMNAALLKKVEELQKNLSQVNIERESVCEAMVIREAQNCLCFAFVSRI
jgi:hypothetical protein